jgi:protein CWC15
MAHMPTYYAAKGRETDLRTTLTSRKDQAGHKTLKYRKTGQSTAEEVGDREAILKNLAEKEEKEMSKKDRALAYVMSEEKAYADNKRGVKKSSNLLLTDAPEAESLAGKYDDGDDDKGNGGKEEEGGGDDGFDSSSDEEDDSDDEEEDDEAELQAELDRIRAERAAEKERKEAEAREEEEKVAFAGAKNSNPLMPFDAADADNNNGGGSARVKRRWNDDVVFKNQAREEPVKKTRFINDPLRSDFHRLFMKKYLK